MRTRFLRIMLCGLLALSLASRVGAEPGTPPVPLTPELLRAVMPKVPDDQATRFAELLNTTLKEFDINSPRRQAAFLAQLAHESGQLRHMEEIASGEAYEGRKDLGNTQPGDGKRYKGRGPIQLTGRANYRKAGQALGLDLEGKPEQASQPEVGFRVAGWFWKSHGLNELADKGDFRAITRRINGGLNGLESRQKYYDNALKALGANR